MKPSYRFDLNERQILIKRTKFQLKTRMCLAVAWCIEKMRGKKISQGIKRYSS